MQGRKYHNIKTEYNGVMYDSKKEAKRQYVLDMMARAGIIRNLERQNVLFCKDLLLIIKGKKYAKYVIWPIFTIGIMKETRKL